MKVFFFLWFNKKSISERCLYPVASIGQDMNRNSKTIRKWNLLPQAVEGNYADFSKSVCNEVSDDEKIWCHELSLQIVEKKRDSAIRFGHSPTHTQIHNSIDTPKNPNLLKTILSLRQQIQNSIAAPFPLLDSDQWYLQMCNVSTYPMPFCWRLRYIFTLFRSCQSP